VRSGVSTASFSESATFAAVTGTFDANYPVGSMSDLNQPSKVARVAPAAGVVAFTAVLSADRSVQVAALVAHTLPAGATVRTRFFSDAGMTTLVTGGDLGPTAIPTPVSGYKQTYPALMDAAQTVRAVRWDIASAGASDIDIGAAEIAQWWEWPKITATAELGFDDPGEDLQLLGGGAVGQEGYAPNTYAGQVAHMDIADSLTLGVDFQKLKQLSRPFVFVEDYSDSASWPRTCFLALNVDLPQFVAQLYDRDAFQFRLREHVR
jgi:hypothetical protein